MLKKCKQCNEEKDESLFPKTGRLCKACKKIYWAEYYQKNRTDIRQAYADDSSYAKEYYQANKEKIKAKEVDPEWWADYYERNKARIQKQTNDYYHENKEAVLQKRYKYRAKRYRTDINFKLAIRLRSRLSMAIRGKVKLGSAVKDLGCTLDELKIYLESKFQSGMSWDNYGQKDWHIDHVIPLASFDLTDKEQFLKACHYTNLQPLWAIDNLRKSDKV